MKTLLDGMLTGLFLQLALGPVFFFILGITVESNYTNSLAGIAAVTLADYIYIALSLIGIGQLLRKKQVRTIFGCVSAVILIFFGVMLLYKGFLHVNDSQQMLTIDWTPLNSFTSCFVLTISSPLTIVFWSSVFSTKAMEKNYQNRQLVIFGLATGASTFLFLSSTMWVLSFIKSAIPDVIVQILNSLVGSALIYYGITKAIKAMGDQKQTSGRIT